MPDPELLRHATTIVTAHVAHNDVPAETLSDVIRTVYAALNKISAAPTVVTPGVPAVPVNKSVFPDFIVCLEDGRKLKTLKRHLWSSFGMTPDEYRAKWGLPAHYPMISPNYAARRSALAKKIGLGGSEKRTTKDQDRAPGVPVQRIPEGVRGKKPGPKKAAHSSRYADRAVSRP
jgi:predicted transcriptional regulator